MKLPLVFSGSGGNGHHNYGDAPFDNDDEDSTSVDELSIENVEVDFTEYLWMENEEEFDKIEWQRLEEEELMNQCLEMLEEDESLNSIDSDEDVTAIWLSQSDPYDICQMMSTLEVTTTDIVNSTLNPLAKEFVPSSLSH